MTLAELTAAVDMLRTRGVKSYTDVAGGGFTVEFFPREPDLKPEPASKREDRCACGHMDYEHVNGLCAAAGGGCDPTRCAPVEKKS